MFGKKKANDNEFDEGTAEDPELAELARLEAMEAAERDSSPRLPGDQ
jgi:hypothetical protein